MASKYLVTVFLVTAGEQGENLGSDEQEVVLFAWLVLDMSNGKIVAVQQHPVKPRGSDINENLISEECRNEYGVTEEQLKNAHPLEHVIEMFDQFVHAKMDNGLDNSFVFVCDGQLPLRQVLHPEASRKGIPLPEYYYSFFDLRKEFSSFYRAAEEVGSIQDMLNYLGLEEDGSAETGVKKAQEMSKIALRLAADGYEFKDPEPINIRLDPGICSKTEVVDSNTVVRARGLPWQSSDQDIAKFFRGLNIVK